MRMQFRCAAYFATTIRRDRLGNFQQAHLRLVLVLVLARSMSLFLCSTRLPAPTEPQHASDATPGAVGEGRVWSRFAAEITLDYA